MPIDLTKIFEQPEIQFRGNKILYNRGWNVRWVAEYDEDGNASYYWQIFFNGKLSNYPLSDDEIDEFNNTIETFKTVQAVKSLSLQAEPFNFNKELTAAVLQGQYAITSSNSSKPVLGAFAAWSSLIVAIHDSACDVCFVGHIEIESELQDFASILQKFNHESSEVYLYGGDIFSEKMCATIISILQSHHFNISQASIIRYSFEGASLAIDSRTGKIYSPVDEHQLETVQEHSPPLTLNNRRLQSINIEKYNASASCEALAATSSTSLSHFSLFNSEIVNPPEQTVSPSLLNF